MEKITEQTRAIQVVETEMLKVFVSICQQLNLKYYLWGGTLLGAVRHSGFIPWDDDIDVCMPRKDFERFTKEAQALLPEHLFLQTYKTDPEFPHVFAKIRNSNTTFLEKAVKERKMNHGIFIDIFPLDEYSEKQKNALSTKIREKLIESRLSYLISDDVLSARVKAVRVISKAFYPTVRSAQEAKEALHKSYRGPQQLANYSGIGGNRDVAPAEWYQESTEIMFEGIKANAPAEYHKVLTKQYGNYMQLPPVEKRVTHHFTDTIDTEKSYCQYTQNEE